MSIVTSFFALAGGLDLVTPAIQTPAGRVIAGVNYEPSQRGYRRMDGYERLDGRPKPSRASYWVLRFENADTPIAEDDIVTGGTSGAVGRVVVGAIAQTGDWFTGDAAGYIVLMGVTGTFVDGEDLEVSAVKVAEADGTAVNRGALNDDDDNTWLQASIEKTRAAIQKPPGSGPIRGVWTYDGDDYAFRDNAGATACVMHKATPAGWAAVSFGTEIAFTAGGLREIAFTAGGTYEIIPDDMIEGQDSGATATVVQVILTSGTWAGGDAEGRLVIRDQNNLIFKTELLDVGANAGVASVDGNSTVLAIEEGDTITGGTSGATATVLRVVLETGDWSTHDAAGRLIIGSQIGTFVAEGIETADQEDLATVSGNSAAITLPAGGRYDFVNHNFFGSSDLLRMYGVNGVGRGFEWDGTVFVPIQTGMTDDRPIRVDVHQNHLFFAYRGGSLQHSSIGNPYSWEVITGAAEIGIGEEITDLLSSVSGTLAVFGQNKVSVLFGDDAENWVMRTLTNDAGAAAWTAQKIGTPVYLDTRGLRTLDTTDAFGDFNIGTITQLVEPIFAAKRAARISAVASIRVRSKDQYRIFFADRTGLTVYFGGRGPEILPFELPVQVSCASSGKNDDGDEVLLIGTEDGTVYQLDAGTNFDGDLLEAFLRLPFNHVGSPSQRKRWLKTTLEMDGGPNTTLGLTAEFGYADPDQPPAQEQSFAVKGSGGFWNEMFWDQFYWSSPVEGSAEAPIDGLGRNLSIAVVSRAKYEQSHTLHGLLLHYSYRGIVR